VARIINFLKDNALYLIFIAVLTANIALWTKTKTIMAEWGNVSSPPSKAFGALIGLGDDQIAYRVLGYILQNTGNTGGQYESLKAYNYENLEKWFFMAQSYAPWANYVPFLAAYYFGAVDESPEQIKHVVDFLAEEGEAPYPEKWRWLAHAVYLARYQEKNLTKALALAERLAQQPGAAAWAKQMPAFIQLQLGNREASYAIMLEMLKSEADKLHPNEVNYMKDFICTRALTPEDAAKHPLCVNGS
jgi:hypothetical protein